MLLLFTHKNRTDTSTEALTIAIRQASCHDDKPILAAKMQMKSEISCYFTIFLQKVSKYLECLEIKTTRNRPMSHRPTVPLSIFRIGK